MKNNYGERLCHTTKCLYEAFINELETYIFVIGHTKPKAPDPIRTPKLSGLRHG